MKKIAWVYRFALVTAATIALAAFSGGEALAAGKHPPGVGKHPPGVGKHKPVMRNGQLVKPGGHPNKGGGARAVNNLPEGVKPGANWTRCERDNYWRLANESSIVRCPNRSLSNSAPYRP